MPPEASVPSSSTLAFAEIPQFVCFASMFGKLKCQQYFDEYDF